MYSYNTVEATRITRAHAFLALATIATVIIAPTVIVLTRKETNFNVPPLKPPVQAAAPSGLKLERRMLQETDFSFHGQVKDRFFESEGPSSIYLLLDRVDGRTKELNERATSIDNKECLSATPIQVDIPGWPGQNLTMWAQCYEQLSETLFMMFGVRNNKVYLYEKDHHVTILAYADIDSEDSTTFSKVDIYFAVGNGYTPLQTGSRGLMHLEAIPGATGVRSSLIQASMAGIGMGFCGVELVSDGEYIKITGSQDGIGGTCNNTRTICLSDDLNDVYEGDECDDLSTTIEPLGRRVSTDFKGDLNISEWATSHYPGGNLNNVEIGDHVDAHVTFGPSIVPNVMTDRKFGQ